MKVIWKNGYRAPVDAQLAYDTVSELHRQGKSTAQDLVDASRPDDAPLHKCFEWNDRIAAEAYRRNQAMNLVNHILLIPEGKPNAEPVRALFNLEQRGSIYEPTELILRTPDKRKALLEQAKREMLSFMNKYNVLDELCKVFSAMDEVIHQPEETE